MTPQDLLIQHTNDAISFAVKLESALLGIYALVEKYGWSELGYDSAKAWWKALVEGHFSYAHVMKWFSAFDVASQLEIERINIVSAQYLNKLPAEQRNEAYQRAGGEQSTDLSVKLVVQAKLQENAVLSSNFPSLQNALKTGQISAEKAYALKNILEANLSEKTRLFIELLITEHNLQNPDLAEAIAKRHEEELRFNVPSLVLQEIRMTHCLGQRPLADCTLEDWKSACREASREHLPPNVTPLYTPFNTDLLLGNPQRTAKTLYDIYNSDGRLDEVRTLVEELNALLGTEHGQRDKRVHSST